MGEKESKKVALCIFCHAYHTMINFDTITAYLKIAKKYTDRMAHSFISADVSLFLAEMTNFCYIKNPR